MQQSAALYRRNGPCVAVYCYGNYEWDAAKSTRNLTRRGFDCEFATLVFSGPHVEVDDRRRDYGERRVIALGVADGIPLTIVYIDRVDSTGGIIRRLISARVSHRKERRRYVQALEAIHPQDAADTGAG